MSFPTEIVIEGRAKIVIPKMSEYLREDGIFEPAHAPVFYNPKAKKNRDIAVALAKVQREKLGRLYAMEPLAGTGVRSIRFALEASADMVIAVDSNPLAVDLIYKNIKLNKVENVVRVLFGDANAVMYSKELRCGHYMDLIDVDPFGSPMPFIDAAIRATRRRGLVMATATDGGPLTGSRPQAALRKYGAKIIRTPVSKEFAIRILMASIMRVAAVREVALNPVLNFFGDYYVRVSFTLDRGASRTDEVLENLGYVLYCKCHDLKILKGYPYPSTKDRCECGDLALIGPLWLGPLTSAFAKESLKYLEGEARELVRKVIEEDQVPSPTVYRVDAVASYLRISMPSPRLVVSRLREVGFKAFQAHYDYRVIKTDAPYNEVIGAIKDLSPSNS